MPVAGGRLTSLDGLRGIAALVVVAHHAALVMPQLAGDYDGHPPRGGTVSWLFSETPLHLLWAGPEAVLIFFVLSGYVLTLPSLRVKLRWAAYYPARIVRLYLPVWAATLLAAGWIAVIARHHVPGSSWWLDTHVHRVELHGWLNDVALLDAPGASNSVLWSLKWEVVFSLLLPLYLLVLRSWWSAPMLLAVMAVGVRTGHASLEYLPMFGLGVVLAREHNVHRLHALSPRVAFGLLGVALMALNASWYGFHRPALTVPVEAVAACAIVALAAYSPVAVPLSGGRVQWMGRVSFSLYLVHEPIVVSTAYALGGRPPVWAEMLIAVPVALLVAEGFYRGVEVPTVGFAHAIRKTVVRRAQDGPRSAPGRTPPLVSYASEVR